MIKILILFTLTLTSCVVVPRNNVVNQQNKIYTDEVSFQVFYDELSPYGAWIDYSPYGYVWVPESHGNFMPYLTNGRWMLTDYGWTWISDYRWGWAPFHYGRWSYNNDFGWFWVPGNEWGPAWVTWRESRGYYGWSPMEPGMSVNESIEPQYSTRNNYWVFVRDQDLTRRNLDRYNVSRNEYDRIIRNSEPIRHIYQDRYRRTTYVTGPRRTDVQRLTGEQVRPLKVQEYNRPGHELNSDRLQIYRPRIEKNTGINRRPEKVISPADIRRTYEDGNRNPVENIDNNQSRRPETDQNRRVPDNKSGEPSTPSRRDGQINDQNAQPEPINRTPDNRTAPGRKTIDQTNKKNMQERQNGQATPNKKESEPNNRPNVNTNQNIRVPADNRTNQKANDNPNIKPDKNRDIVQPSDQTRPERQPVQTNQQKAKEVRERPVSPARTNVQHRNTRSDNSSTKRNNIEQQKNTNKEQPRKPEKQDENRR